MSSVAVERPASPRNRHEQGTARGSRPDRDALRSLLAELDGAIPPLWPLRDYVAVNPWIGLADMSFLEVQDTLKRVRDCELLMPREYFLAQLEQGGILGIDLTAAFRECQMEYPHLYTHTSLAEILQWIRDPSVIVETQPGRIRTVAERIDLESGSNWSSNIINDLSRHCAAHFDEGQAAWASPWSDLPLYEAWREASRRGRRMEMLGLAGFRRFVAELPASPSDAIQQLVGELNLPESARRNFLLCELMSVAGWASYVKHQTQDVDSDDARKEDLIGLLAIRLAYDVALVRQHGGDGFRVMTDEEADDEGIHWPDQARFDLLARHLMQVAVEAAYRRNLCQKLIARRAEPASAKKTAAAQMVFCIDVRSEVFRRHIEAVDGEIETFGFAGFFGVPLEYAPLTASCGTPQCPVLLKPNVHIHEGPSGASSSERAAIAQRRKQKRQGRKIWKIFQSSAASCFSFVESVGLAYVPKLLTDMLGWTRPFASALRDGLRPASAVQLAPDLDCDANRGFSAGRRVELAESILRNLGLTTGFSRMVVFCGHAAQVTNNPYQAALDCGACGGHSGEPNARVAAALMNDPEVRRGLADRGIQIPLETWFVAAVHETTTDTIRFCDSCHVPASHTAEVERLQNSLRIAGDRARLERSQKFPGAAPEELILKSFDWSEVRPEWGLAGNAAFVIAPRRRTSGLDLGGRTFLHSYDARRDPDGKVLELILTAPMVVTNWINLQYYASTVDNRAYGSGNKAIHNVVGQFGVFQGNGGDLMTGLPWQCVHDGQNLRHEPLRLLVVVEATRERVEDIISRHELVRNLVSNGWIHLVVLESDRFYRWSGQQQWQLQHSISRAES